MAAGFEERHGKGGRGRAFGPMLALALCLPFAPGFAAPAAPVAAPTSACPTAGTQSAVVGRVDERLDISLKDGRSLHLAGLDPPQPTPDGPDFPLRARDALAGEFTGGRIFYLPLAAVPDRWGRIAAFVFFSPPRPGAAPASAAIFLLAQGFARFMPVPEAHPCRSAFLAAEGEARAAKLGLWRDPYYAVMEATNRAAFADKAATNIIVEGRLVAVTSGRYRTSLEFARRELALSVTVLQRNVAIFDRSGLDFRALIGRSLRVRGLLDLRFGPHIEISSPDDIELITDGQNPGGKARQGETDATPPPTRQP